MQFSITTSIIITVFIIIYLSTLHVKLTRSPGSLWRDCLELILQVQEYEWMHCQETVMFHMIWGLMEADFKKVR